MLVQSSLEIFIEFLIFLHSIRGNGMPARCLPAPNVAAYGRDVEVAVADGAGCDMRLLGVEIVLQDDIASTFSADYSLRYADVGIGYRSTVDNWPRIQAEL